MQLVAWCIIKVRANHLTTKQAKPQVLVGLHLPLLRPVAPEFQGQGIFTMHHDAALMAAFHVANALTVQTPRGVGIQSVSVALAYRTIELEQ